MQKCKVCFKEFEPKNYWQKYCSSSCKQAMWALKRFRNDGYSKKILFNYGENPQKYLDNYSPSENDIYKVKISFFKKPVNRLYQHNKKEIKQGGLVYSDSFPDLDNGVKPVIDSFKDVILGDDRKIVELLIEKFFSNVEKTTIEIRIYS